MIHIGTAGWSVPARYKHVAAGSQLERYATRLNAVEINSSFHRHHQLQTYTRWAASVPATFKFSVKVPRALTHEGELTPEPEVLDRFIAEISGLGPKLALLLVQLPPKLAFDERAVIRFFSAVRKRIDVQLACEPRHPDWGSKRADEVLVGCEVARVAADPPPWPGAGEPGGCKQLAYFRWHGHPRKYYSSYDQARLAFLRRQLALAGQHASQSWSIFDNTVLGCAFENALAVTEAVTLC